MTPPPLISTQAPAEVFKELVEEAIDHQGVETSDDSAAYLVSLLDSFVCWDSRFRASGVSPHQPLAETFLAAWRGCPSHAPAGLRFVGDLALFMVGFFADGLRHDVAGARGYVLMGGSAYGALARSSSAPGAASLFNELATRFVRFADVLTEVAENCAPAEASDLLRLYERWLATGSRRSAVKLRAQGILLEAGSGAVH